jgi:lipoprotein-releasing system permease protein
LGFVFLTIAFLGGCIEHFRFFGNLVSNTFPDVPSFVVYIFLILEIGYIYSIARLFLRKYRSVPLRITFAVVGSLTGLGLPVILAIFLYKVALQKIPNIINLMSAISVFGVSVGTMGLVIVLSVFNGFDDLIRSLYNAFDPDLKITVAEGKTFRPDENTLKKLSQIEGIAVYSKIVEESVLLKYGEKQYPATLKGVDHNYVKINGLDTMIREGSFMLEDNKSQYAIIGQGIAYYLQVGIKFITPLVVYFPRKEANISMSVENAFNQNYIYPSGIFAIEQDHDAKYMIVPIRFAFSLLEDSLSISALELKTAKGANLDKVQQSVQKLFGNRYQVKNRYQQQELFYRIMKYEKWAIFMILTFILMVASFNIIGSLSMLIIEKKKDISTFNSVGANSQLIRRIFLYEGMMISFFGAFVGLLLGLFICWLQIKFGLVRLEGSGSFIIDAYPVSIRILDIFLAFLTVLGIGYLAAWYPVKYIIRRYIPQNNL